MIMVRVLVRLLLGALLALGIAGGALAAEPGRPAQAGTTWNVKVGGSSQDQALQAQAFLPSRVTINEGDTINWIFQEVHTVTFLSGAQPPALVTPSNEGLLFTPAVAFPSGGPSYDGTGYVNSGVLPGPGGANFALTFAKAGTYDYLCLLHPGMVGQVVVQAPGSAYPATQAQIDAEANTEQYGKLAAANDLLNNAKVTSQAGANGATTYHVNNGVGGNQATVLRFLPVELRVRPGDSVTWTVNDPHEIHTVTFYDPSGKVPPFLDPQPQPAGPPKIFIRNAAPEGGTSVDDQGLYNSGILAPGQSYTFSFPKPGVYTYVCTIHAETGMFGKIIVEGPTTPASLPRTGAGADTLPLALLLASALALLLAGALVRRFAIGRAR
jgi:plastocyanin